MVGFKGQLIHTFNKNESAVHSSEYFQNLSHRHNVMLMGDSLGDCHMADGCQDPEAILKIGFLNHGVSSVYRIVLNLH